MMMATCCMRQSNQIRKILPVLFLLNWTQLISQVSISNTGGPPLPSAIYEVRSTSKGLLIPRMTTLQRMTILNPATGLLVYDIGSQAYYYYSGTEWIWLKRGLIAADADGDTRIWVERNPNENIVRFDLGGMESLVLRKNISGVTILEPAGSNCLSGDSTGLNISLGLNNALLGAKSGHHLTFGTSNTALGNNALFSNMVGMGNIAIGQSTLFSDLNSDFLVAVGDSALYFTNSAMAVHNTGIGHAALNSNISGKDNTMTGFRAGYKLLGNNNTAIGEQAFFANYDGEKNTIVGAEARYADQFDDKTTICGSLAGYNGFFCPLTVLLGAGAGYDVPGQNTTICGFLAASSGATSELSVMGYKALYSSVWGSNNIAFGSRALYLNGNGANNVGIGDSVMYFNSGGIDNTAMGHNALKGNVNGKANSVLGNNSISQYSLYSFSSNVCIGSDVMGLSSGCHSNVAIGKNTMLHSEDDSQVGIGDDVLSIQGQGEENVAIGSQSLKYGSANSCTALGESALHSCAYAPYCSGAGVNAMRDSYAEDGYNSSFGAYSLMENYQGENMSSFGYSALRTSTAKEITGFGYYALSSVDTYIYGNSAFGYEALRSTLNGIENTAIGYDALSSNTFGDDNIAVGYLTLTSSAGGSDLNLAIGSQALQNTSVGDQNIAVGYNALNTNSSGSYNVGIGHSAASSNTTGSYNTSVGYQALNLNTTGVNRVGVGRSSNSSGTNYDNSIGVGDNADCTASNQARIGDNAVTSIGGYAAWTNVSDARVKKDVVNTSIGLDFVMKLRPVTYQLDISDLDDFLEIQSGEHDPVTKDKSEAAAIVHSGFIAQEVEADAQLLGFDFDGVDKPKNKGDLYGLRYEEFTIPLVNSVKEQQQIIAANANEIEKLKSETQQLLIKLEELEKAAGKN